MSRSSLGSNNFVTEGPAVLSTDHSNIDAGSSDTLRPRIKAFGRVGFAALVLFAAVTAQAWDGASPIVRSIEIEGLESVDQDQVLRVLPIKVGQPVPALEAGRLVRAIEATGFFRRESIDIDSKDVGDGGIAYTINVRENPTIVGIEIDGAEKIKPARLLKILPYKTGDILRAGAIEEMRLSVLDEYRRKSFYQTVIRVATTPDPENDSFVKIRVIAIESDRRKLKDVIIEGVGPLEAVRLRMALQNKGSWGPVTRYYSDDALAADIDIIRILKFGKGYLDVEVEAGELRSGGSGKGAWISPVIKVTAGRRYGINTVSVRGATMFSEGEIIACFRDVVRRTYSGKRFRKAIEGVKKLYGREGHLDVGIDVAYDKNVAEGAVDVELRIREGDQIRVGRIMLERPAYSDEGAPFWERWASKIAPRMKEEAIMREVTLASGDVYRTFEEERTRRRLRNLGVFNKVAIRREATADPGVSDVIVSLEGEQSGFLTVGGGISDASRWFGYLDYTERNMLGEGNDLSIYLQIGEHRNRASISYTDRHLGESDYALTVGARHSELSRDEHDETMSGVFVALAHPFAEDADWSVRLRGDMVSVDADDNDDTEEDFDQDYVVATISPSITIDRRDDIRFPRRGYIFTNGLELGVADGALAKIDIDTSYYTPLPRDFVMSNRIRLGLMGSDSSDVGITERYYLGGANSLRGFEYRGAGPKDARDDDVAIGGATLFVWQTELRYPIGDTVSAYLFNDLGYSGEDVLDFGDPRSSVGFGARFDMRPAALSIDFGWPIVEEDTDETEMFQLRFSSRY